MDGMLAEAHDKIAADLANVSGIDARIVHVGDYVDRGPDSAGVIERLSRLAAGDSRFVCLMGNHDELMAGFLDDPVAHGPNWFRNGADATLRSYGIAVPDELTAGDLTLLSAQLAEAMPPQHRDFVRNLPRSVKFGDFFFCHAGIRPGVPLARQSPDDLTWIREPFLGSGRDHGAVIVHGHTPANTPEVRSNRINVDTGAVYGGPLTVLAIDGTQHRFL